MFERVSDERNTRNQREELETPKERGTGRNNH